MCEQLGFSPLGQFVAILYKMQEVQKKKVHVQDYTWVSILF